VDLLTPDQQELEACLGIWSSDGVEVFPTPSMGSGSYACLVSSFEIIIELEVRIFKRKKIRSMQADKHGK
jgi:hypothetical protein